VRDRVCLQATDEIVATPPGFTNLNSLLHLPLCLDFRLPHMHIHVLTRTCCMCHHRHVSDELNKMRMKEKYLNNQHNSMSLSFIEVKHKLESLEQKSSATHEKVRLLFFCTV
jgi:hypothetical protein